MVVGEVLVLVLMACFYIEAEMPRATQSGKSAAAQAPEATKTRKAPTATQKEKVAVEEAESSFENVMEEAPAWARALQMELTDQIDSLGEYVEDRLANLEAAQTRVNQ